MLCGNVIIMIIIHGDNTVLGRKKLVELIEKYRSEGKNITRLEAKFINPATLESALGSSSLFGEDKVVVIEELHSLPTSKRKKELISGVATSLTPVILFEKKSLTKTMLGQFQSAEIHEFKISNSLWELMDSLGNKSSAHNLVLLKKAITDNSDFFVFTMICRQIRLLIQAKDGGMIKGAPFMIQKLNRQVTNFSLSSLIQIHQKLSQIDLKQKTSAGSLNLSQELDLLLIKM